MRLIDAEKLKGDILSSRQTEYEFLHDYIDDINEQPTAYDLDGVVEQLQDNAIEFELFGICSDYVPLDTAIKIVKGGAK